jgi:hypothetical protein
MALIFPIPSVTQCPVYNLYDSLVWKEILSDDEHSDTLAHAEISRLMQLLAQRDVKLSQKNAELAQKEIEISFYDAELARKDIELDQKNAELDRKDAELAQKNAELARKDAELAQKDAELAQLLSQRDEESARNAVVINDVAQELLSVKQELAQRDAELVQERMCLRDRTLPAPIDVQMKLDEMFKSWPGDTSGYITYLLPKIRAATEQIKEPIMGLFHVTYSEISTFKYMYTDAMLFTATDMYYLTNSECDTHDTRKVIVEDTSGVFIQNSGWRSRYTFTDPKWVKWHHEINKNANFKKIITYIYQYSGYTGMNRHSNPNGMNSVYIDSGSQTASSRYQQLIALAS